MKLPLKLIFPCCLLLFVGCSAPPFLEMTSEEVAPGVRYAFYQNGAPNQIHVLTIDLQEKGVRLESARLRGLVRTSEIAAKTSTESFPVVAAANADFFSFKSGWPVGIMMHDGELWTALETGRSHMVVNQRGEVQFARMTFDGGIAGSTGREWRLDALNQPVSERGSALQTHRWYDSTNARACRLAAITGSENGTRRKFVVDSVASFGRVSLHESQALLAFGRKCLDSLGTDVPQLGDTLWVDLRLKPTVEGAKEILGGAGRFLADGLVQTDANIAGEKLAKDFIERRHPRTFVGLSNKGRELFVCVVDGRQSKSVGMNFQEMAEFLQFLGADDGFNFDGGGSTTMVVRGRIVNSPSDKTGERPVANAFVIRTAGLSN